MLYIGLGLGLLLAVLALVISNRGGAADRLTPNREFRIADYRKDGSRFAATGNRYVLQAKVENIETQGSQRLIMVSMPGNGAERLPLFLPGDVSLNVNITRGDEFLFEVHCANGSSKDGSPVRGILLVQDAQAI